MTNQQTAASCNTEDEQTMNAESRAGPLKLRSQGNSTATTKKPDAPTAPTPASKADRQRIESVLPEVATPLSRPLTSRSPFARGDDGIPPDGFLLGSRSAGESCGEPRIWNFGPTGVSRSVQTSRLAFVSRRPDRDACADPNIPVR